MRYTLCLMPMHLALHCIAAECGVHATAMGVHPGIQGMAPHFPDTQMHAGMHAGMHTSMHFLVPDALMRYASCLMPMHCILGGGKWRACGCYGRASRHLEDAYVLACTQACTPMHWHALSPVPYALCITISSSFGWFRPDFGSVHAICTQACMPARQNLHTHLRASYILLICMVESIPRAYTWLNTRGSDVCYDVC